MLFIKRLDLYVLKNFLVLFLGTFCISLFVVLLQFSWRYIDELVGKGLEITVLAQFFWYATLYLVPVALPLAVLLASLISMGNMGERLELLAIKASGISLFRALRSVIVFSVFISIVSFYFQDKVMPDADNKFMQLLFAIRIKSPELDIPEGMFYDGIDGNNIYVEKKDKDTGLLHNVIIYNFRTTSNNAHIILADSAKLETSANKKHITLHLYNGEQFENTDNASFQSSLSRSNVPYRRETFIEKHFVIDFDTNFSTDNTTSFDGSAKTKNIAEMIVDIDSLKELYDSIGRSYFDYAKRVNLCISRTTMSYDSTEVAEAFRQKAAKGEKAEKEELAKINLDTIYSQMTPQKKQAVVLSALQKINMAQMDSDYKQMNMEIGDWDIKSHIAEIYQKITMALACLLFFFIGAPLGAIIRKGGLGMPVVVAVLIFIFYYIVNTAGVKVGREGGIPVLLGVWLSTIILTPLGVFLTIKSNNDSAVFNMDSYKEFFRRVWGIRQKRHITGKEVIIHDPDYVKAEAIIDGLISDAKAYIGAPKLKRVSYFVKLYIGRTDSSDIDSISERLEAIIDVLSNSKKRQLVVDLNRFPIIDRHSFRFYRRVRKDMKDIIHTGEKIKKDIYGK